MFFILWYDAQMQKTVVYIDAANIALSAQNLAFDLDILRLVQYLKDTQRTDEILYFTGKFKSRQAEFDALKDVGVELVYKEIYNEEHKAKANCDVEIAHRVTLDIVSGVVEKVVLLSGDGDFVHLYDYAKRKSIAVKVMAFDPKSCSKVIKRREFVNVSYLLEQGERIRKEKPPAST